MGKKGRERFWGLSCVARVVLSLFMLSPTITLSSAEKLETVFEDRPQIMNTFYDPKFHDDGSDSQAVESVQSFSAVTPSKGYSFTTMQDKPRQQHSSAPSVLFETGSFQEFHEVAPINEAKYNYYYGGADLNNVQLTESKYVEPVSHQTTPPESHEEIYHQFSNSFSNQPNGPDVIYAPDGWVPNTATFPDSDTTYAKPVSSSPTVKWPEDERSANDDGNITPQLYDYVEPALPVTTPKPPPPPPPPPPSPATPIPVPLSTQYHYSSPSVPTSSLLPTNPVGYQFRIPHSPMLSSIGNYVSSSVSSLFRSLPKIQLIGGSGSAHNIFDQQSVVNHPQPQTSVDYKGYSSGGYNSGSSVGNGGHSGIQDTEILNQYHSVIQPTENSISGGYGYSGYSVQTEGPNHKFIPTIGYSHGRPPSIYEYAANYPPAYSYEASPSYEPSAYVSQQPEPIEGPKWYPSRPPPKIAFQTSYQQPQKVVTATSHKLFPSGRVNSATKGSLASLYYSGEDFDGFQDVGEDVPLTPSYKDTIDYTYRKPLKSYYTTPERYHAILNGGTGTVTNKIKHSLYSQLMRPSYTSQPSVSGNNNGISSQFPSSVKYWSSNGRVRMPYGSMKSPGSVSDDYLFDVQNSYGTPKDLKKPSTIGYYRTRQGSWARIPYIKAVQGYNYKYQTTLQLPSMERDPLLLDLEEDEADNYDGINEGRDPDPDCENKRACGATANEYQDIAENVEITRRPKTMFTNSMFKKLMRNAVRQRRPGPPKGRRNRNLKSRGKGKRRRCRKAIRCRKY